MTGKGHEFGVSFGKEQQSINPEIVPSLVEKAAIDLRKIHELVSPSEVDTVVADYVREADQSEVDGSGVEIEATEVGLLELLDAGLTAKKTAAQVNEMSIDSIGAALAALEDGKGTEAATIVMAVLDHQVHDRPLDSEWPEQVQEFRDTNGMGESAGIVETLPSADTESITVSREKVVAEMQGLDSDSKMEAGLRLLQREIAGEIELDERAIVMLTALLPSANLESMAMQYGRESGKRVAGAGISEAARVVAEQAGISYEQGEKVKVQKLKLARFALRAVRTGGGSLVETASEAARAGVDGARDAVRTEAYQAQANVIDSAKRAAMTGSFFNTHDLAA